MVNSAMRRWAGDFLLAALLALSAIGCGAKPEAPVAEAKKFVPVDESQPMAEAGGNAPSAAPLDDAAFGSPVRDRGAPSGESAALDNQKNRTSAASRPAAGDPTTKAPEISGEPASFSEPPFS